MSPQPDEYRRANGDRRDVTKDGRPAAPTPLAAGSALIGIIWWPGSGQLFGWATGAATQWLQQLQDVPAYS